MIAAFVPAIGAILVYALPRTNIGGQMVGIYLVCGDASCAMVWTNGVSTALYIFWALCSG
jgi:hypothetical protein